VSFVQQQRAEPAIHSLFAAQTHMPHSSSENNRLSAELDITRYRYVGNWASMFNASWFRTSYLEAKFDQRGQTLGGTTKFFAPWSNWTWYATEGSYVDANGYYDTNGPKTDFICFGWVEGDYPELGYFSLNELQQARGPFGLGIERDLYYTPKTLKAVIDASR
jgi:Protein of unknown function (DUF2958)